MTRTELSEEEFSPAQLLPENEIKELFEPKPYRVTGEAFLIDVDACGRCYSDADPGL